MTARAPSSLMRALAGTETKKEYDITPSRVDVKEAMEFDWILSSAGRYFLHGADFRPLRAHLVRLRIRVYLERTHASTETVNRAAEIRTLAERQIGAFLKRMPKNEGTRPNVEHGGSMKAPPSTPTFAEIGVTKKQSATAQKLADIPEPEFHERIAVTKPSDSAWPQKKTRVVAIQHAG